jgi:glycosyltransferase involved in cell wall biosynthesis
MKSAHKIQMRLLIFIYSMGNGGAERVTANLANYWAAKGWDITIVTLAPLSLNFYELHPAIKSISLYLASESGNILAGMWNNTRRVLALRQTLRQIQPNIALGMMSTASVLLALAAWGLPTLRTIGTERNFPPQQPLGYLWENLRSKSYGLLNAVTALTSEGQNWIKNYTKATKVMVIPNPVTWPLVGKEPQISPRAFCQTGRQLLLAVGRLDQQKRFDWLIEAFTKLAAKHSNWDLAIVGEGSLRAKLERQVRESGFEKRIFLPGRAGNVNEWYEQADLFVISSHHEGFPNTLIEAMSYGLAAVSFDCDTGPRDIIRHELDGLIVPPGDVAALSAALDKIMGDDLLRLGFAERAIEVRERFSIEKMAGLWEQLFEDMCK